jgi:phage terminase large subunit
VTLAPATVDPVRLAEFVFGHSHWATPAEIIRAVFTPNSRVAVKACHASSKTFTAGDCVLLALLLGGDVITTAPTWLQVQQVLWGQIHRSVFDGRIPPAEWGSLNQTEIRLPTGEFAIGLSTNEGVRFQGFHAREGAFLLVIFDEAPGVIPSIYEARAGIAAGGDVRFFDIGNPVLPSGPFYDTFISPDPSWRRFTIDAFDTPNLAGVALSDLLTMSDAELDHTERPYLVTRRWVRDRYYEWGEDSPAWQSRVRGQFPVQSDDALISLAWLEAARVPNPTPQGAVVAGIDVAGPGEDETVLVVRSGDEIVHVEAFAQPDARGPVLAALRPWLHRGLARVNYDEAGSGWYFGQHLRESLPEAVVVNGINVGEATTTPQAAEQFANLKAELYWSLRERFRDGDVSGLTDQATISQLAGLRYEHDSKGRVKIESKDDARKRGVKSPDRAEALMLAYAPRSSKELAGRAMGQGARYTGQPAPARRVSRGSARGRR